MRRGALGAAEHERFERESSSRRLSCCVCRPQTRGTAGKAGAPGSEVPPKLMYRTSNMRLQPVGHPAETTGETTRTTGRLNGRRSPLPPLDLCFFPECARAAARL